MPSTANYFPGCIYGILRWRAQNWRDRWVTKNCAVESLESDSIRAALRGLLRCGGRPGRSRRACPLPPALPRRYATTSHLPYLKRNVPKINNVCAASYILRTYIGLMALRGYQTKSNMTVVSDPIGNDAWPSLIKLRP